MFIFAETGTLYLYVQMKRAVARSMQYNGKIVIFFTGNNSPGITKNLISVGSQRCDIYFLWNSELLQDVHLIYFHFNYVVFNSFAW